MEHLTLRFLPQASLIPTIVFLSHQPHPLLHPRPDLAEAFPEEEAAAEVEDHGRTCNFSLIRYSLFLI